MAFDQSGLELPNAPLPSVPQKAINDLLGSMEDLEKKQVPAIIAISGDQGTGKTVAGMEFLQAITPNDKRIVYVDTAMNFATFNNHPNLRKRVKVMEYENMEQLLVLAQALRVNSQLRQSIGAVMIDEYSSAVKADRKWIVRVRAEQSAKEGKFKDKHHPSQADYLSSQIRSEEVVQAFLLSGVHVVFITHEKTDERVIIRPDFAPGAANDFQRLVHGVYRSTTEIKDGKQAWKLQLQPAGSRVSCKNRIGGLDIFGTALQVADAYKAWGIIEEVENDLTLTPAEAETITNDENILLKLLEDNED